MTAAIPVWSLVSPLVSGYTDAMRTLAAVLAFLACSELLASDAGACVCGEVSPCERFARTSVVFAGEVLEVGADGFVAAIPLSSSRRPPVEQRACADYQRALPDQVHFVVEHVDGVRRRDEDEGD